MPALRVEPAAAGPFLLRSAKFRALLADVDDKVTWAEMEAFGFMQAAHEHDVKAIMIKGISDLGDEQKSQLEKDTRGFFRLYAAANASRAALAALERGPLEALRVNDVELDLGRSLPFAQELGATAAQAGEQVLAYPRLLSSEGPVVGLEIAVTAEAADGRGLAPRVSEWRVRSGRHEGPQVRRAPSGRVAIDDWPHPVVAGAAFVFPEAVARLAIAVRGRFGLETRATWEGR
jgi:hypothetical protein